MAKQRGNLYEFGPFRVDPTERLLLREGHSVAVKARVFDILLALIRRSGHLVDKSELMTAVWADSFVEEGNLTVGVSLLRKALGDDIGLVIRDISPVQVTFFRPQHRPSGTSHPCGCNLRGALSAAAQRSNGNALVNGIALCIFGLRHCL
jgi:hypothetical protein